MITKVERMRPSARPEGRERTKLRGDYKRVIETNRRLEFTGSSTERTSTTPKNTGVADRLRER